MNKFTFFKKNERYFHYALFLIFLLLCWSIIPDFGVTIDDQFYYSNGVNTYQYIKHFLLSLFKTEINLEEYRSKLKEWPIIFELLLVLISKLFNINEMEKIYLVSHQLNFIIFFISLIYFHKFIYQRFNSYILATLSIFFLILSPRIFAESFYNSRDIFFMSLFILFIYYCYKYLENNNLSNILKLSICSALLINTKILGLIPFGIFCILYIYNFINTKENFYKSKKEIFQFLFLTFFFIYLFWPYLWTSPVLNLYKAFKDILISQENLIVVNYYFGNYIQSTSTPWHYRIVWLIITTPIIILFLSIGGILFNIKESIKIIKKTLTAKYYIGKKNFIDLLLFFILLISFFIVIEFNNSKFGGWRHLYYIYPIIIYFSIYLLNYIFKNNINKKIKTAIISIILLNLLYNLNWIYKNHPNQYVYFNLINKGYFMNNFDLDWWGISHRESIKYILDKDDNQKIKINGKGFTNLRDSLLYIDKIDRSRVILTDINSATYIIDNKMKRIREYKKKEDIVFSVFHEIKVDGFTISKILKRVN